MRYLLFSLATILTQFGSANLFALDFPNHAVNGLDLNLGLSASDGRWSYYSLSFTSSIGGVITGGGTRHDVSAGAGSVAPSAPQAVQVAANAKFDGAVISTTNSDSFIQTIGPRVRPRRISLLNQVVSETAFFAIPLNDNCLIKGALVYNVQRMQTVRLGPNGNGLVFGWRTNSAWYSGQVFGNTTGGLTGSASLGD